MLCASLCAQDTTRRLHDSMPTSGRGKTHNLPTITHGMPRAPHRLPTITLLYDNLWLRESSNCRLTDAMTRPPRTLNMP